MTPEQIASSDRKILRARIWGPAGEFLEMQEYDVHSNCRRIEVVQKSGMHADIPYVQIFDHLDNLIAEFCQHGIVGIFYDD